MTDSFYQTLAPNTIGHDFVVGDIHGCFDKLEAALARVNFNNATDRLISVGDLVDRGSDSLRALHYLEHPWFYAVRGNHEEVAILWADRLVEMRTYMALGGEWNISRNRVENRATADRFRQLPIALELNVNNRAIGIVHADCVYDEWDELIYALNGETGEENQTFAYQMSLWSRARFNTRSTARVHGIDYVFVGHSPTDTVLTLGNVVYIDTGAVYAPDKPLTLINLHDFINKSIPR